VFKRFLSVSDTFGVAGIRILRAIAEGETSAKQLAALATTNIKRKGEVEKALKNYLTAEHCRVIKSGSVAFWVRVSLISPPRLKLLLSFNCV
jgi:hypothetical protein